MPQPPKKYIIDDEHLMQEWDWEANADLDPSKLTVGSKEKAWWKCSKCGGKWQTHICSRTGKDKKHHTGCPYCAGKKVLSGFNDLKTKNPDLATEWHPTKNGRLKPSNVIANSGTKIWWKCPKCKGEWQTTVDSRSSGHRGCPYCAGKKVLSGFNDLKTTHPDLAKEWHPIKNNNWKATEVIAGSHKKAWWKCSECEYEWQAVVESRALGNRGCPVCSNKICVPGKNDLKTTHPDLAKEWHPTKNGDLSPINVTKGYDEKVWWKCPKCHGEWQCHVYARTGKDNTGCPYCAGQKVLPGFNDLETVNPHLAAEWHPTKNGNLKASTIYANSNEKVWWICHNGHEYQATVNQRNYALTNCPICNLRNSSSFPEQAIFYYVKKLWPNALNKYKDCHMGKMELDIYIPEIKTAIEYDGVQWHKTNIQHTREIKKYEFCKKHEIYLIRIKECSTQSWDDTADKVYNIPIQDKRHFHSLEQVIQQLLYLIRKDKQFPEKIDIEHDKNEILSYLSKIDNSLAKKRPDVAIKWNYEKNGNLNPEMFSYGSGQVVWWKCQDCGHQWQSSINHMTTVKGNKCPKCHGCNKSSQLELF